jgi:hypothetical protein
MDPKEIKFEDMKDLSCGDLIIMKEVMFKEGTPYVLMSIEPESFYFTDGGSASLMVNCQDTIDGFNVRLIDDTHPSWDQALSDHGKMLSDMLSKMDGMFNEQMPV